MTLNQIEIAFIDNQREKGKSWYEIGISFGMKDEAIRSLYRRGAKPQVEEEWPETVSLLRGIQARLDSIEAGLEQERKRKAWQVEQAMQS